MNSLPYTKAESLLNFYSINSPHYNLEEIANAEGLIVEEDDLPNHLGRISFSSAYGLIKIDSKIKETGQKRFTLAHEMGHYFNEREIRANGFYKCTALDMYSFKSQMTYENEANEFASELLMHKPWFSDYIKNRKINFELIKDIASEFNVSLTAAAFRYANIGKYPVALIMSKEGYVAWSYKSDYFPFKWIPRGYKVRRESGAYTTCMENKDNFFRFDEVQTVPDLMPACVWFAEDRNCREEVYFYEQNVAMPNYNSVLTLLWESEFR